jgi:hypothetical protein
MNFGDIYSYRIDISANTTGAKQATAATQQLSDSQRRAAQAAYMSSDAFKQVASSAKTAAVAVSAAGVAAAQAAGAGAGAGFSGGAGGRFGGSGFGGLANAMAAVAVLADDLQYGSRNVANNLIFLGSVAPHPALKTLGVTAGLLTSLFHKQIDEALGLGVAYKEASGKADEFKRALAGINPVLDELIAKQAGTDKSRGALIDAIIGDQDLMRRELDAAVAEVGNAGEAAVDRIRQAVQSGGHVAGFGEFMRTLWSGVFGGGLEEQAAERVKDVVNQQVDAAKKQLDLLEQNASKNNASLVEYIALLRKVDEANQDAAMLDQADALERQTEEFAQAAAKADLFTIKVEQAALANKKLADAEKELNDELADSIQKMEQEAQKAEEVAQRKLEAKQREAGDLQANAFRDQLSGGIQNVMRQVLLGGGSLEQGKDEAFRQAFAMMQRAGVGFGDALAGAKNLVDEQAELMRQFVANIDALIGLQVAQQRQGTWGRRMADIQGQQIRQMALRNGNADVWRNNRRGWP